MQTNQYQNIVLGSFLLVVGLVHMVFTWFSSPFQSTDLVINAMLFAGAGYFYFMSWFQKSYFGLDIGILLLFPMFFCYMWLFYPEKQETGLAILWMVIMPIGLIIRKINEYVRAKRG